MEFVQEHDVPSLALGDLLEHRLHPLLELATVLGAGQHGPDVQGHQLLVGQGSGDVPGHDSLGQTFHDGGFSHARLPDEDRIVLGAPGQHLHHPSDLLVPADDRIQLPQPGSLGEVPAVSGKSPVGVLGGLIRDSVGSPDTLQSLPELLQVGPGRLENLSGITLLLGQAQEEMLRGNIFVAQRAGFRLSHIQGPGEVPGKGGVGAARDPGPGQEGFLRPFPNEGRIGAKFEENGHDHPVFLIQEGQEKVDTLDLRVLPLSALLGCQPEWRQRL